MWIIPNNLQLSNGAPDTEAFISDLNEQSQICASSLMVRSKPSPARTWSQKWRRDSWTRHLSGRILKPSHHKSFVTEWTCLWPVIPASHSAQQGNDLEQKTRVTSGHTSPDQFELFAPDSVSSRMSKDTSALDSERSLESWKRSVIKRRGEYSARLKSAHRTSASGSSSWPTIRASEYKDTGPIGSKSHDHMLGKGYLCAVVTQDAWQTPTTNMDMVRSEEGVQKRIAFRASIGRKSIPDGNLGEQMQRVLKDAANWPTPAVMDTTGGSYKTEWIDGRAVSYHNHKEENPVAYGAKLSDAVKYGHPAPAKPSTDGSRPESWLTPRANEPEGDPNFVARNADRGEHCHGSLGSQVKSWATPIMGDSHLASTPEVAQKRIEEGKVTLSRQMAAWATPQLQDGHNINQDSTTHKTIPAQLTKMNMSGKLNPRWVETLMGLPIGWTMPSCTRPVIIAPTNSDSSATESSQPPQNEHLELF